MTKKKPRATRITIIIFLVVLAVVAYYAYLSNRSKEQKAAKAMTAAEEVLARDLSKSYPPTPKEVVKYYNEFIKCYYNEKLDDDQIDDLGIKARELYDEKLLAANELGSYLYKLREDIKDYQDNSKRITSTAVASSTDVDYYTRDGYSFARIVCTYNLNTKGTNETMDIVYLLRKDADKKWKIYGWDFAQNVDFNGDGIPGD